MDSVRVPFKVKVLIAVLAVLLLASLAYIAWGLLQQQRDTDMLGAYKQGYVQGVTDTTTSFLQYTDNCNAASVVYGNRTRQVIDVACLSPVNSTTK